MPCPAWGIPKQFCKTGAKLALQKNTICSKCYGNRGPISWPAALNAQHQRYDLWRKANPTKWIQAMITLIAFEADKHFRWFDMGDLQSVLMLHQIIIIAESLPWIKFWLPTQEKQIVLKAKLKFDIPNNLIIRISTPKIEGTPCKCHPHTSTVERLPQPAFNVCEAHTRENKCGPCRKCWNKQIPNIVYHLK